jgi:hypothetical protein
MYIDLSVFNFSEKIACFAFYLVLWTELRTCKSTNLKWRWLDLFWNYYHIQCVCNHSTALVVIFCCNLSFCHNFCTSTILSLRLLLSSWIPQHWKGELYYCMIMLNDIQHKLSYFPPQCKALCRQLRLYQISNNLQCGDKSE